MTAARIERGAMAGRTLLNRGFGYPLIAAPALFPRLALGGEVRGPAAPERPFSLPPGLARAV